MLENIWNSQSLIKQSNRTRRCWWWCPRQEHQVFVPQPHYFSNRYIMREDLRLGQEGTSYIMLMLKVILRCLEISVLADGWATERSPVRPQLASQHITPVRSSVASQQDTSADKMNWVFYQFLCFSTFYIPLGGLQLRSPARSHGSSPW